MLQSLDKNTAQSGRRCEFGFIWVG